MTALSEYAANVAQGARVLDAARPGWESKVDVSTLDMRRTDQCVLGQVFDGYWAGLDALVLDHVNPYGFTLGAVDGSRDHGWTFLGGLWEAEIVKRRQPTVVPVKATRTRVAAKRNTRRVPATGTAQVVATYAPGQNISVTKRSGVITGVTTWVTGVPNSTTRH